MNTKKIYKEHQGTIVDVRTPEEFLSGNFASSINIPLQQIQRRIDELKNLKAPLILCCIPATGVILQLKFLTGKALIVATAAPGSI